MCGNEADDIKAEVRPLTGPRCVASILNHEMLYIFRQQTGIRNEGRKSKLNTWKRID